MSARPEPRLVPHADEDLLAAETARRALEVLEAAQDERGEATVVLTGGSMGTRVIREIAHPAAFNVGLNLGSAAGGSLAEHLHQHVVPRWTGDANFMPVIAHTKPLIQTLGSTREDIAAAWPGD